MTAVTDRTGAVQWPHLSYTGRPSPSRLSTAAACIAAAKALPRALAHSAAEAVQSVACPRSSACGDMGLGVLGAAGAGRYIKRAGGGRHGAAVATDGEVGHLAVAYDKAKTGRALRHGRAGAVFRCIMK
jgi:hypothetical protein